MTIAIAGIAEAGVGDAPAGSTPAGLMAEATRRALDDAGLPLEAVDGILAATTQLPMAPLNLAEALNIRPRFLDGTQIGGSSAIVHLRHAAAAIEAGLCETAVIAYGSTQKLVGRANASVQELDPQEAPFKPLMPVTAYALAASRHMHEFGTTREQLAEVAVAARAWANQTPGAYRQGPLTIDDVLQAPMICDPLSLRDCCLVTDGAAAIVVVRADRAPAAPRLLGAGEATTHRHISHMPDLTATATVQSGAEAFARAGITPQDIDSAQLYDAFTITPILFLEDLGFCAKGEGGAFVQDGRIAPGGSLPVNTNGGGLSYAHPGMYGAFLITEAVRRLRGGDRLALAHGNGGVLSSQATAILAVD